jgi:hypothetical protein
VLEKICSTGLPFLFGQLGNDLPTVQVTAVQAFDRQ